MHDDGGCLCTPIVPPRWSHTHTHTVRVSANGGRLIPLRVERSGRGAACVLCIGGRACEGLGSRLRWAVHLAIRGRGAWGPGWLIRHPLRRASPRAQTLCEFLPTSRWSQPHHRRCQAALLHPRLHHVQRPARLDSVKAPALASALRDSSYELTWRAWGRRGARGQGGRCVLPRLGLVPRRAFLLPAAPPFVPRTGSPWGQGVVGRGEGYGIV